VAFIGSEQRRDVEAGRWFSGRQLWALQCIGYGSGGEIGGGKTEGRAVARWGRRGGKLISGGDAVRHGGVWPAGRRQ
jgi:hypothetical protein